jgi:hypothetical protein
MGGFISKQNVKEKEKENAKTNKPCCKICKHTDITIIHQASGVVIQKCKNDHIYSEKHLK